MINVEEAMCNSLSSTLQRFKGGVGKVNILLQLRLHLYFCYLVSLHQSLP